MEGVSKGDAAMWNKLSAAVVTAAFWVTQPLQVLAQQTQPAPTPQAPPVYWHGPWHMWGDGPGWHFWWMGPVMMLVMLLFCATILYFLFGRHSWGGPQQWGPPARMMDRMWGPNHSALQILGERYARGEIQKDEYEEKKAALLSGS
jgi:putative membrane protein